MRTHSLIRTASERPPTRLLVQRRFSPPMHGGRTTGTCKPATGSLLRPGSYPITATYSGDSTYAASTSSPPQTLTVVELLHKRAGL